MMDGAELFTKVRRPLVLASDQTPEYTDIQGGSRGWRLSLRPEVALPAFLLFLPASLQMAGESRSRLCRWPALLVEPCGVPRRKSAHGIRSRLPPTIGLPQSDRLRAMAVRERFGECEIRRESFSLLRRSRPVKIEPKVFDVLLYLVDRRDRVVTKHELLDALWPGEAVSDSVLPRCIAAARRAVGDTRARQRVLQTVHGRGTLGLSNRIATIAAYRVGRGRVDVRLRHRSHGLFPAARDPLVDGAGVAQLRKVGMPS